MRSVSALLLIASCLFARVAFEPNRGQAVSSMPFLARTARGLVGMDSCHAELRGRDGRNVSVRFEGARKRAAGIGQAPHLGVSHYAMGDDPSRWLWDIPRYSGVLFRNVYDNIDVSYHASKDDVEFDFLVATGSDPSQIELVFSEPVQVSGSGQLKFSAAMLHAPRAWQTIGGKSVAVRVEFEKSAKNRVKFRLGSYNRHFKLTIDPIVELATFLGGSDDEGETRMSVGAEGEIYLTGSTMSADFPAPLLENGVLTRPVKLFAPDVYVVRVRSDGDSLDWSLLLGGNAREAVLGLKQDDLGNLYVLGRTYSPNFPVTTGAYRTRIDTHLADLFLMKLDARTGHIKVSTFLGIAQRADDLNRPALLAVTRGGSVYIAGGALDGTFRSTAGCYQENPLPNVDARNGLRTFVVRLNETLSAPVYATLFEVGAIEAMGIDAADNLVMGGYTTQINLFPFPAVRPIAGVTQTPQHPDQAFVAILNSTGTSMLFASLLHGNGFQSGIIDLKIAKDGSIHVLGETEGDEFPQVNPPVKPLPAGDPSLGGPRYFWTKLPPNGGSPLQSGVFDGYSKPFPVSSSASAARLLLLATGIPCMIGIGVGPSRSAGSMLVDLSSSAGTMVSGLSPESEG